MGSRSLLILAALAAVGLVLLVMRSNRNATLTSTDPAPAAARPTVEEDTPEPPAPDAGTEEELATAEGEGRVEVRVIRTDKSPVADAVVRSGRRRAETDDDGMAVLDRLPEGRTIPLRVEGPEHLDVPESRKVAVPAEGTARITVTLHEGGAVAGSVTDETGRILDAPFRISIQAVRQNQGGGPPLSVIRGLGRRNAATRKFPAGTNAFEVGGLEPGKYVAAAEAEGHVEGTSEPFEIRRGAITRDVVVSLARGGRVSGVVLRRKTGEPVANATVALASGEFLSIDAGGNHFVGTGQPTAKTDREGRFVIDGVKPGEYTLQARAPNLATGRIEGVVVSTDAEASGLLVSLGEGGALTGTVYDANGRPLADATVLIQRVNGTIRIMGDFGERVKTNEDGVYLAEHLDPGRYRVKRPSGGGGMVAMRVVVSAGGPEDAIDEDPDAVLVLEGQVARKDLRASAAAGIRGTVVDGAGEPVRQSVELVELDAPGTPDSGGAPMFRIPRFDMPNQKGEFAFEALEPGTFRVRAGAATETVTLNPGEVRTVHLVVQHSVVEGVVLDESGRPTKAARITLRRIRDETTGTISFSGFRGNVQTDGRGQFLIEKVDPGRYRISAWKGEQMSMEQEIEIAAGQTLSDLRLRLETATEIVFELRNAKGKPAENAFVSVFREESHVGGSRAGADGDARIRLLPGTYRVQPFYNSGNGSRGFPEKEVVVGRGGTQRVRIRLE